MSKEGDEDIDEHEEHIDDVTRYSMRDAIIDLTNNEQEAHQQALQMAWQDTFEVELACILSDESTDINGRMADLSQSLQEDLYEHANMSVGDYCVTMLHIREVIICHCCLSSHMHVFLGFLSPTLACFEIML